MVLGGIGLAVGSVFGQAQLGLSVGTFAGSLIDNSLKKPVSLGRLSDLRVTSSAYGTIIPQVWGSFRVPGSIIWADTLKESSKRQGSKLLGTQTRSYTYSSSFACLVCKGPRSLRRIWGPGSVMYDLYADPPTAFTLRLYRGDETQLPDPLIVSIAGSQTPAYRGSNYVVFDTLPLADWGNALPNPLSFEVTPVYPDLILSHASNRIYYQFATTAGKLSDSGSKQYTLTDSSPASTRVTGCFQALNGASGGGDGIQIAGNSQALSTVGNDLELQGPQMTVEGWFQFQGGSPTGTGANKFRYFNPSTGEYSWSLIVQPSLVFSTIVVQFTINVTAGPVPSTPVHNYSLTRDTLWHHVMVTYDTAGSSVLYVDGVSVSTGTVTAGPITMTSNAASRIDVAGGDMRMDELAWHSSILTAADAANHHTAGVTGAIPTLWTTGGILADLFGQAGLTSGQYNVAAATDAVDGFVLTDRQDARSLAQPLLTAYDTYLAEVDGQIQALKRGAAAVATIPAGDLAARLVDGPESDPPPTLTIPKTAGLDLPFRVELTFYGEPFRNYLQSMQAATRYTKSWLQNVQTLTFPLVLTEDYGRQVAEKLLYRAWLEAETPSFVLPPKYLYLAPGDVLSVPTPAGNLSCRIQQLDLALPGPIQVTAVLDDAPVLSQSVSGGTVVTPVTDPADVINTTLVAWSGNALTTTDADGIGFYATAGGATVGFWGGASLQWSRDGGTTYAELDTLRDPATIGAALSVLAAGTTTAIWDDVSTVDVSISSGSAPASTSDSAVLSGDNAAILGDEVIQFGTVTPLTSTTYRLSHLLRGRRGTDGRWDTHAVGEPFALLDVGTTHRINLDASLRGKSVMLKAVANGQAIALVSPVTLYVSGDEAKPYAPVQATGARDGSLNLTAGWTRRDRKDPGLQDNYDAPMSEATEAYTVSIRIGTTKAITGITNATAAVITATAHGYSVNDLLFISGVLGMIRVNGVIATVTATTTNTVTVNLDTSQFRTYVSGGTLEKIVRTLAAATNSVVYSAANQSTDFGSTQSSVRIVVTQTGKYGAGYSLVATV